MPHDELLPIPPPAAITDVYHQAALQPFLRPEGLFAVPLMFSPVVLAYHKGLFDQAGLAYPDDSWTWVDLVANALLLTRFSPDNQVTTRFGFQFSQSVTRFSLFLAQHEARLLDDAGRPDLNNERVREVVEFCTRFMHRYRVSPICLGSGDPASNILFSSGKIAMALTTLIQVNDFKDMDFEWGIAPPPKGRIRASVLVAFGLSIPRQAPRPDLAGQLVNFLVSRSTQSEMQKISASLPVLKELLAGPVPGGEQSKLPENAYEICNQVCPYAITLDKLDEFWLKTLRDELTLTWGGMETPASGCARAQAKAMQLYLSMKENPTQTIS